MQEQLNQIEEKVNKIKMRFTLTLMLVFLDIHEIYINIILETIQ